MDPWLAKVYGTNDEASSDLEKTAQTFLLQKMAEEEGIDLSGLSDEELNTLAASVLSEDDEQQTDPAQPGQEGYADPAQQQQEMLAKEAQAKFDEADFLGRIMAHSYTQELEKIAAAKTASRFGAAAGAAKGALQRGAGAAKSGFGAAKAHVGRNKGRYGAGAAGAGGFAAGRMSKGKNKEATAFEKLAEMHAANILQQAGIDPSTGMPVDQSQPHPMIPQQPQQAQQGAQQLDPRQQIMQELQRRQQQGAQQPQNGLARAGAGQSQGEQQFGQALDQRALEILEQNGYDVSPLLEGSDQETQG